MGYYAQTYSKPHTSYDNDNLCYFAFLWRRRDEEKTNTCITYFVFFFLLFLFYLLFFFFCICPKLWKKKPKSNRYVGRKRRHLAGKILRTLISASRISYFDIFGQRDESDKTKIIVICQLQNEIPKWHISVTIWKWVVRTAKKLDDVIPLFY